MCSRLHRTLKPFFLFCKEEEFDNNDNNAALLILLGALADAVAIAGPVVSNGEFDLHTYAASASEGVSITFPVGLHR